MKFEEFERKLWAKGYGIAAMNHYTLNGIRYTYCVVLHHEGNTAFKFEAERSEEVFEHLYRQVTERSE